jgi:hypothetical protein
MKAKGLSIAAVLTIFILFSSCDSENNAINNGPLPPDPNEWVCREFFGV